LTKKKLRHQGGTRPPAARGSTRRKRPLFFGTGRPRKRSKGTPVTESPRVPAEVRKDHKKGYLSSVPTKTEKGGKEKFHFLDQVFLLKNGESQVLLLPEGLTGLVKKIQGGKGAHQSRPLSSQSGDTSKRSPAPFDKGRGTLSVSPARRKNTGRSRLTSSRKKRGGDGPNRLPVEEVVN